MRVLLLALALLLAPAPGRAQEPPQGAGTQGGDEITIWLMTFGPGEYVWERFGHNAIRVQDRERGTDVAYNYGMFSFQQEDFILRFIRGHMDYWMEGFDSYLTADSYMRSDRSVWLQELNLTPAQRVELRDFLEWNARPENRVYRYDYYRDNCSTRVRDAIDRVLGGQIRAQTEGLPSGSTYRSHTRSLTGDDPVVYTGLMAGLGQPVDREISVYEEMFLPLAMLERVRDVTVTNEAGSQVPLVAREEIIYASTSGAAGEVPAPSWIAYLVVGLVLAASIVGASLSSHRRAGRVAFGLISGSWAFVAGLLGIVLLGLWLFTDHTTSYRNENLFFLNPLLFPMVVLLPLAARRSGRWRLPTLRLSFVIAVISLVGLVAQILPMLDQANGEIIALALPVNLAIAFGVREISRRAGVAPAGEGSAGRHVPQPAAR